MPPDEARLKRLTALLRSLIEIESQYSAEDPTWMGIAGSQAERDRSWRVSGVSEAKTIRVVNTAYAAARVGILIAEDQLRSLARLVDDSRLGPARCASTEVLARSAVEISARSWWLLEARLPTSTRVERYLADQLYSAYQAEALAQNASWLRGVEGFSRTTDEVASECSELGFACNVDWRTSKVGGQSRPTATKLVSSFLRETLYMPSDRLAYSLVSATAHGTLFALMRTFWDSQRIMLLGEPLHERFLDHGHLEPVAGLAASAVLAALRRAVDLTGWKRIPIDLYETSLHRFIESGPNR
jgi:hypothetical protein